MYFYCKEQAFTLVELIITLAVLAIIATLAIPSYFDLKAKQELNQVTALVKMLTQSARSYALTYHSIVVICSSSDLTRCNNDQWNSGVIIFSDLNNNEQVDTNETIHTSTNTNFHYGTLRWNAGVTSTKVVTFQGDTGLPRSAFGSFYYCNHELSFHRRLILPKTGILRFEDSTC